MNTDLFGLQVKYGNWNKKNSLPLYIASGFSFKTAYIENVRCVMIKPKEELATIPSLKKQISKIQEVDNVPVILKVDSVSSYRRKSLIENKIPFITGKQVFLPFIGALLTNENESQKTLEKFVFSTQQLFLFYLYSKKKKLYISDAAKTLPFTAMTLTRATKQLEMTDLFVITKDGVNKVIESKYSRLELFEKAKKYLSSPICKTGYIDAAKVTGDMVLAGDTALAEKTMLNAGKIKTFAIRGKDFDRNELVNELINPDSQVKLELWAYDPKFFSNDNMADNLSVALSFIENDDERIEGAIEKLIDRELREE